MDLELDTVFSGKFVLILVGVIIVGYVALQAFATATVFLTLLIVGTILYVVWLIGVRINNWLKTGSFGGGGRGQ